MKGAIIGDIVGSVYEFDNIKSKVFPLFSDECDFTDDTIMTVAAAEALMTVCGGKQRPEEAESLRIISASLQRWGRRYPNPTGSYGGRFDAWLRSANPKPYNSWGNGAAMRCSAAGWLAESDEDARYLGRLTALPSHDHPEALKAASLTAELIILARVGVSVKELRQRAEEEYTLPILKEIRRCYDYEDSCPGTMPVALSAFFESTDFEDAIRNAVSVGGDSDTIAAITGSIAEAYYGIPDEIWEKATEYLDPEILDVVNRLYDAKRTWKTLRGYKPSTDLLYPARPF